MRSLWIIIILGFGIFPGKLRGEEGEITPESLNRTGYRLVRQAEQAAVREDLKLAYDRYREAIKIYRRIGREFPDWQPRSIAARLKIYRERARQIGEEAFELPDGYIRIRPGMPKEGRRFDKGRALAMKVKKLEENEYEVGGFTVTLVRAGPLLGAACSCPDFMYRGKKHGFACKHIWAVIEREGLFRENDAQGADK